VRIRLPPSAVVASDGRLSIWHMANMNFEYSRFQKLAIKWLTLFTAICFVNSISVIGFELYTGDKYLAPLMNGRYSLAYLLPFVHCGIVVLCVIVHLFYLHIRGTPTGIWDKYIQEHHPEIWKRFHPWGDRSYCNIYVLPFLMGRYDDGLDKRLNRIKFDLQVDSILLLWTIFLNPVIWIFNFILTDALGKFPAR
jgi:hypothetical protein